MYSIGKLAKLSQVTVRTFRYYDEIGLLKPAKIGDGGHRYYDNEAIEKLHNIMMLKDIGFELETIHEIIANQVKSYKELLHMRLEIIHQEQLYLKSSEDKIRGILHLTELEGQADWEAIFNTFSKPKNTQEELANLRQNFFTENELEVIKALHKQVEQWVALINDIRLNLDADPSSKTAQELAKKWLDLVDEMFEGDWELAQKVWHTNWDKKAELGFYDFDKEVIEFMGKAHGYYFKKIYAGENHE